MQLCVSSVHACADANLSSESEQHRVAGDARASFYARPPARPFTKRLESIKAHLGKGVAKCIDIATRQHVTHNVVSTRHHHHCAMDRVTADSRQGLDAGIRTVR